MLMLTNQKELKQIYNLIQNPIDFLDHANNIGYYLGLCSWNNNTFDPYIGKLVKKGILKKLYDFTTNNFREALYEFKNGNQIEFFGENHMSYKVFYSY